MLCAPLPATDQAPPCSARSCSLDAAVEVDASEEGIVPALADPAGRGQRTMQQAHTSAPVGVPQAPVLAGCWPSELSPQQGQTPPKRNITACPLPLASTRPFPPPWLPASMPATVHTRLAHSPLKVLALRGQHNLAVVVPANRGVVGQAPAVRVHLWREGRPAREGRLAVGSDRERSAQRQVMRGKQEP